MDLGGSSWEGDPFALEESRLYTDGISLELILQMPLPEGVFSFFPTMTASVSCCLAQGKLFPS